MGHQDNESVDLTKVYAVVLSVEKGLRTVDSKCDQLGKEMAAFALQMNRVETLEKERNIPGELKEQETRITNLEKSEAVLKGQILMLKVVGGFIGFVVTVLTGWQIIRSFAGK